MAMQRGKLADIQYIPAAAGSIYSNPAATKTYIRGLVLHNTNAASETIQIYNVPDSSGALGTAGNGNKTLKVVLAADETLFVDLAYPFVLTDTNDSIQATTTTASKVTVQILGDKDA